MIVSYVLPVNSDQRRPDGEQIDEQAALTALDGSRELLCELAEMFCEDAPLELESLKRAIEEGDARSARRATHSLKGLASTFFARSTVDLAQRLENAAARDDLQAFHDGGFTQLERAVSSLIAELKTRLG